MEKNKSIMGFKRFFQYFKVNESSFKEERLNTILDKISNGDKITQREKEFLDKYHKSTEKDFQDFKMLTKISTFSKITEILEMGKKIICNLTDKYGKIGRPIDSIYNDYTSNKTLIKLENEKEVELKDNFFYELNYNFKKDEYTLEEVEEFYEKIPIKND